MYEKNILSFKNYVSSKFGDKKIIKEKGMSQNEIEIVQKKLHRTSN